MRRQSKIEATLNKLFKKPSDSSPKAEPDLAQPAVEPQNTPVDQTHSQNSAKTPTAPKEPKSGRKRPQATHATHAPMRVDTISTTFTLDLNEVLVSPPFEELPAAEPQVIAETAQAEEKKDQIEDFYNHQIVTCMLNEQFYAVKIDLVEGIIKMQEITSLPIPQPFIAGIIHLRGSVLPIINLRKLLGLPPARSNAQSRHILLVNTDGFKAGLIVDQVSAVLTLPNSAYETLPSVSGENPFVAGVARNQDKLILLLDLKRMINRSR
jgi:purine-binding chemotaxis protein CheW